VPSPEPYEHFGPDGTPAGALPLAPSTYHPKIWLHILLFVLTFASTTIVGGLVWGSLPEEMARLSLPQLFSDPRVYFAGLKFSIPLLTILGCHELGHYVAARRHGLTATPPFFIPFPVPFFGIGTLGAVIRIKDPIRNKKELLDVGAAGPIAGFAALVPFLAYGIAASEVGEAPVGGAYLEFGEPLIYRFLEALIRPGLGDDMTLWLHPTGVAAWFGILVTLLNLRTLRPLAPSPRLAAARRARRPRFRMARLVGVGGHRPDSQPPAPAVVGRGPTPRPPTAARRLDRHRHLRTLLRGGTDSARFLRQKASDFGFRISDFRFSAYPPAAFPRSGESVREFLFSR